jgi:dynein heavy chain 1
VSGGKRPLDDQDARTGIPLAKKKLAELELSLLHLQQNVDIPEISLHFHPAIEQALEQCAAQGRKATPEALGDIAQDSSFLNRLQADVNGWIREIHKVTKLQRDPASGTASQEVNFWLNLEKALVGIEANLKNPGIGNMLIAFSRQHLTLS